MPAPTLLVGLGGSGSTIVQKVFQRATAKQRENIGFVIFDTDVNELNLIRESMPQIRTIQISEKLTVGQYLGIDTEARDTWFPVNPILNTKSLTEGAGQVRAISRLALNTAIKNGYLEPLNGAIEELYKLTGSETQQAPRVIVTGSLCGGTGSGLILPVCLYIRNYMTTKLQKGTTIIRGFYLLPEVFDTVIHTQSERNNLKANAYAAVREINAFMLKDSGALSDTYDLHFYAPKAGSEKLDEYTGNPMDFCFLFDAQNINGQTLNNYEQYKEHAANCIYGMAIAPTSKRSNSSEDNVIRQVIYSTGRRRFAGSGTSMLVYPTDDVKRYVALQWTKDSISREWLMIDDAFEAKLQTNRRQREAGYQPPTLDRGKEYVEVVDRGLEENPFYRSIRNMNIEYDETGIMESNVNWSAYVDALMAYIDETITDYKSSIYTVVEKVNNARGAAKEEPTADNYLALFEELEKYLAVTKNAVKTMAQNTAYTLFKDPADYTRSNQNYRLEYWMRENQDIEKFNHPNAVRYFLYKAKIELDQQYRDSSNQVKSLENYFDHFENKTFDTDDDLQTEDSKEDYLDDDRLNGRKKKVQAEIEKLNSADAEYTRKIDSYLQHYVRREVCKEGINFITMLSTQFESFYDVLRRNIKKIDKSIEQIETKYSKDEEKGQALRYVCADEECLKGIASEVKNPNINSLNLPAQICRDIYQKVKAYALADQKPEREAYFTKVFQETVVAHLENIVVSDNASVVSMDILTALEKEAEYLALAQGRTLEDKDRENYVARVIKQSTILARPFIEGPSTGEAHIIESCAYNPSLADADIPGRTKFVNTYLKGIGGEADASIDENMILFYSAVYGLCPEDLSKFSPEKNDMTDHKPAGDYYKAYFEQLEQIHPVTTKSRVVTPHIDRWWHVLTKMPDLNEESQKIQQDKIFRAFIWSLLGQYIEYNKVNDVRRIYEVDGQSFLEEQKFDQLIVSNGTACDHLYEVLDAFMIYPRLVACVLNDVQKRYERDTLAKKEYKDSTLAELLGELRVQEEEISGISKDTVRSVLELPLLMKWSVPADDYSEERMTALLQIIVQEIREYVRKFTSEKEFASVYGGLLSEQYKLFITNTTAAKATVKDVYEDTLYSYICKTVAREFDAIDMHKERNTILENLRKATGK
ncbi:MAG: hypothetical protein IKS37_05095 [Solobacterium sp.]|nr:hypothetical protein [Solobacterium sp.]